MARNRSRSLRIYLRRRKAQLRREAGNPAPAIDALLRQFPRPARGEGDSIPSSVPRASHTPAE